jgi:hypothetical protein
MPAPPPPAPKKAGGAGAIIAVGVVAVVAAVGAGIFFATRTEAETETPPIPTSSGTTAQLVPSTPPTSTEPVPTGAESAMPSASAKPAVPPTSQTAAQKPRENIDHCCVGVKREKAGLCRSIAAQVRNGQTTKAAAVNQLRAQKINCN